MKRTATRQIGLSGSFFLDDLDGCMDEAKYKAGSYRARAFSLLEIVIVLAIIAIVSAIAVPRFASASARYRANSAALRIVADMKLARARAYSTSASVEVWFDAIDHTVSIPTMTSFDDSNAIYVTALGAEPYHAELVDANFAGNAKVIFDIYGQPNADGMVVLKVGQARVTIVVDKATGEIAIR